jgi:hypothetical protein
VLLIDATFTFLGVQIAVLHPLRRFHTFSRHICGSVSRVPSSSNYFSLNMDPVSFECP